MSDSIIAEPMMAAEQTEPVRAWRAYGVVPAGTELPDLESIADASEFGERNLEVLTCGPVAAVVEAVEPGRPARRQDLLAHSAVLNALATQGPVVPIAFGSAFPEKDQVISDFLAAPGSTEALASQLERLRGCAQFQLRVRYAMDDLLAQIVVADAQISELHERIRELSVEASYDQRIQLGELVSNALDDRLTADAELLHDRLGPWAIDATSRSRLNSNPSLTLSFLVRDSQRSSFEAGAEQAAAWLRDRAVVELLGPLAPFDFVSELVPSR